MVKWRVVVTSVSSASRTGTEQSAGSLGALSEHHWVILSLLNVAYPKIATLALVALLAVGCGSAGVSTPPSTPSSATLTSSAPSPSATPTLTHSVVPPASATPSATVAPASSPAVSCYPLTNGKKCYEPGQYCRNADHGASGVAGNGQKIVCKNKNGWRWELA